MTFTSCRIGIKHFLSAAACAAAFLPALSNAGIINHGDFSDIPPGAVMYLDVTESSPAVPPDHYDEPTAIGNTLQFLNISGDFQANPAYPDDEETLEVRLNTRLMVLGAGNGLSTLAITEAGTYKHEGLASADALTSAALNAFVTILAVDGVPLGGNDIFTIDLTDTFTSSLSSNGQVVSAGWELGVLFEFEPYLLAEGFDAGSLVTKAQILVNNRLSAIESDGATALIDKTGFKITPGGELDPTNIVPEPAALAMLALGLAACGRRRS